MKHETSFLTRCFAMFLAVLMALTGSNVGVALQAFAAENDGVTVSVGKLVADNYELTAEEEALLASGCLTGGTITYTVPTDGAKYVTVDTDNKKIIAENVDGWVPTIARIVVGTEVIESIALDGGVGAYTYSENVFSVEVDYALNQAVDAALQETLLNTPAWLKAGVANLDAVSEQMGNLYILEQAMPALVDFAKNGVKTEFASFEFSDECQTAVFELDDQMTANGGKLDMSVNIDTYDASSNVEYLLVNGADMKADVAAFVENVDVISTAVNTMVDNLTFFIQNGWIDDTTANNLKTLAGVTKNLYNALVTLNDADWTAAEKGTALVSESVDYAQLDTLVAALGQTTAMPEIRESLHVADTTLKVNMSMFNVTVVVSLTVVENKADSNELIECAKSELVLTLAEGATAEEIKAAVEESGIVDFNLDAWAGLYVAEHFNENSSELPETLIEDITYEIKFAPKTYHVVTNWGEELDVHYGYQMTLPVHPNAEQAYDYTVNGEAYAQGEIAVIAGDTNIERASGKAYAVTDLYTVVADNYGNDIAQAILKSGALMDNSVISVRKPDPADAESILQLLDGKLTAQNYNAAYAGLSWVPYSYNGNLFNGASEVPFAGKSAEVIYKLELTNFTKEQVAGILALAAQLKAEAAEQKGAMDSLAGMQDTLVQLDKTKLGALNGVIDVTDFTPGDGTDTDAENLEIRAEMKAIVSAIIANNLDSNNYLKIYNIVVDYNTDGFVYYYKNYSAIKAEINSLAGYLTNLMDNEDALRVMCSAAGYGEYADKIADVETKLNDYNARMSEPNAVIDLSSANLGKLVSALTAEGEVVCAEAGYAYLLSETLTALDESQVIVQVIIDTPNGGATVTTESMEKGTVLTQAVIDELKAKVDAELDKLLGANREFYTISVSGSTLDSLVGQELTSNANIYYTASVDVYTVIISGEADQSVSILDLEIDLPKHPVAGWKYEYTIDGVSGITATTYTFTVEQLKNLFVEGVYTITRIEINEAAEKLENAFADWAVRDENGNIVALNAKVDANKDGIMGFVNVMLNAGYTYIGLNGEGLLYMNEEDTLEVSLQTLINAMLKDNNFGSQTLINLGNNGKGDLISAEMQLGNDASDAITVPFTMSLSSVPGQMATVAKGLNAVKNYMSFQSNNGKLDIKLSLPEKVYEVYLTALLATGNVSKDDITAVNDEIAFMFLYDYLDIITETDATTTSYTNTLHMLGINASLEGYEEYYQMLKKALTAEGLVINSTEGDGIFDISATASGNKAINGLVGLLGVDISAYETYLGMLKEYKPGNSISVSVVPSLTNAGTPFEAAIIDVRSVKNDVANVFDFTTDLVARASKIKGEAAIMLLGDVEGDLVFNDITILDLNGYTINGNVTSNGTLVIVDSSMQTDCGWITGSVSGNVKVVAGNYNANVSSYLGRGYEQVGTTVQHALFVVEADENGNLTYVINTDALNSEDLTADYAKVLAIDIAVDIALNYFTAAALSVDGNYLYHIDLDDMIGFLDSTNKIDELINWGLQCIDLPGLAGLANLIMADLLDFAAIENAIANDEALSTHTVTTAPWAVAVEHETTKDYITFGITYNTKLAKSVDMSIKFVGSKMAAVQKLAGALADIVVAEGTYVIFDLEQPVYADKALSIVGGAVASAEIDLASDANWNVVLGVVMAYGNAEKAEAIVAALNTKNVDDLKAVIDQMTVKDVFDALKAMNRATSFTAMAESLGVTVDVAAAAELESVFHLILIGAGKALEVLEITGMDSKLGNLDKDGDGTYEFEATAKRKGDVSARGYAVNYDVTEVTVKLTVHLFGRNCIVGDVNHDGVVNVLDMAELRLILAYPGEYDIICEYCADVNQDGVINVLDMAELRLMLANPQ